MPVCHPQKNAFLGEASSSTIKKGTRLNQANGVKFNLGKGKVRRIPEKKDKKISIKNFCIDSFFIKKTSGWGISKKFAQVIQNKIDKKRTVISHQQGK